MDHCQIYIYVFLHKQGLTSTFKKYGLGEVAKNLEEFVIGFNQAAERFIVVDVGSGKEAVDSKLRGPSCLVVIEMRPLTSYYDSLLR